MHGKADKYVERYRSTGTMSVIEIGSRNINGSIRKHFPNAKWHGIDLRKGPAVDEVADATKWKPSGLCDMVICCEVLEHAEEWETLIRNACSWLRPGGRIIVTCAGPGRRHHSGIDGRLLHENEYYHNVSPVPLLEVLEESGITVDSLELFQTDTRASGVRA